MAYSDFADTTARSKRGQIVRNQGSKPVSTAPVREDRSVIGSFVRKGTDVATQFGRLAGQAGGAAGRFVVNSGIDIGRAALGAAKTFVDYQTQPIINRQLEQASRMIDEKQASLVAEYKAGRLSKENYTQALRDISDAQQNISTETKKISAGPTPIQRAGDIAETAVNVLTLGRATALRQTATKASRGLLDNAAVNLEKAVLKVPAVKALFERNAQYLATRAGQKLAGESVEQFIKREGKEVAANLLIKRPLFYQMNIADANKIYDDVLEGDYKGALTTAAWVGSQMLNGGPLGAFYKLASKGKAKLGKLAYGTGSFIDGLSAQIGDKNPAQVARFIEETKNRAPGEFREVEKVFRVMQEGNLRAADNDVALAVENLVSHYKSNNIPLETLTPSQIYKDMKNWVRADELWNDLAVKKGIIPGIDKIEARKYTPVRWDAATRNGIARAFVNAPPELPARLAMLNALAEQPTNGWTNNPTLMRQLEAILSKEQTGKDIAKAIQSIDSAVLNADLPKRIAKQFSDLGYTIAMPEGGRVRPFVDAEDTRKLVSSAVKGNDEVFQEAVEAQPQLAGLASWAETMGVSPRAANTVANRNLSSNVVASLEETGIARSLGITNGLTDDPVKGGQVILAKLQRYVNDKEPSKALAAVTGTIGSPRAAITDIRQLTPWEIKEALGLANLSEAREVSKAVMKGYLDTPIEFRGLGDKVVDALYSYNPLHKYYSRIQSALKYSYNPFFRAQERVETKLLSKIEASNLLWMKPKAELDAIVQKMDDARIFSSSMAGEAAQDNVLGKLSANITKAQKRDLAGLASSIAERKGQSLDDLLVNNPEEITDALRIVVQYPNKGVLASSLARTMNVAFFPMRYNVKVTKIAADLLAKQPPAIQKATLQSMFKMRDWLQSEEGIQWQSQNTDAIQLLKWITPVNSIEYTMRLLGGGKPDSMAELGVLGGLPLGFISQILDSQGIISLNKPYVEPKTGDVFPEYVPQTTKARAATAVGDLLGTMFNYPGRTLGLPGKHQSIRALVKNFIETNGSDFEKRLDMTQLTPLQQKWVQVLKGDTSDEAIDALYQSPAPGQFNWYTMPPNSLPWVQTPQIERRTGLPSKKSKSGSKKAKNTALPMPQ